jgi:hypothetical protein
MMTKILDTVMATVMAASLAIIVLALGVATIGIIGEINGWIANGCTHIDIAAGCR